MKALPLFATTLSALLALAQPAQAATQVVQGSSAPADLQSTGLEARLKYHVGNWDQMLTADGNFGGTGTVADLSNSASVLYNNWFDVQLSYSASNHMLKWAVTDEAFGTRTLATQELDNLAALRIEMRTTAPAFELQWQNLRFNGGTLQGSLVDAGAASGTSFVQWITASAGELSGQSWQLSGRVLATGGNNENTRLSITGWAIPSAVPEPGTWAMLLAGGAVVVALSRRRQGQPR
jgi:PEP-CTERM motif